MNESHKVSESGRNSNIELLRIVAMFLIVSSHCVIHSGTVENGGASKYLYDLFSIGGELGVDIFVLISGYFMWRLDFKSYRIIRVAVETWFYSWIFILLANILNWDLSHNLVNNIKNMLPILFRQYWFITDWVLLMLFSPFVNVLIKNINKKLHILVICIGFVIWSTIQSLTGQELDYSNLLWFFLLYFTGAYLCRYKDEIKVKKSTCIALVIAFYMITWATMIVCNMLGNRLPFLAEHYNWFTHLFSPFLLLIAIGLFLIFSRVRNYSSKVINKVGSLVLGVYLCSDNFFGREFIWKKLLDVSLFESRPLLYLFAVLLYTLIVFMVCLGIDAVRSIISAKFLEKSLRRKLPV